MNLEVEILIVEDNARDLELTMRALRKHNLGNRVFAVGDGEEALDFLFARGQYAQRRLGDGPHVILLDMKLPKVDGIEVLRQLKTDERTRSIPVVMVTSSAQERDMVESYRLGVNSYVVKPIDFDAFAKTIADLGFYWLAVNRPVVGS
ncbi:MAG: response regulator receiver protein [Acidobacteria bacterium]|nr:response regulator receiver protein [Acidobacteriota bacterium]